MTNECSVIDAMMGAGVWGGSPKNGRGVAIASDELVLQSQA